MSRSRPGRRRRTFRILRLFFSLVFSFLIQYARARLAGRTYDFFEDSERNRRRAIKFRKTALEMGGVLIKVGQFLSSRVDLLPSEYIEELALLQDAVPAVPFRQVREIVESELGPILDQFASFDEEAVAAASLGQVHRAVLRTGEVVAVKVQRPDIGSIVEADLAALRYIVGWLDRHTVIGRRADLPLILREFEDTLRLELEYRAEGHHAERISTMLADHPEVRVPRVYWSHTSERVLTLQFMEGIKITDFNQVELAGISRPAVAETLLRIYLVQVVQDGFFHADPHPGNILVRPGPQVVLLDFGMVGEISPAARQQLRRVFIAVVRRDYDSIVDAADRLGFIRPGADLLVIRRAIAWTIETFSQMSFAELQAVDPRMVIDHLQDVLYSEAVRLPANYAFLGRALGTLSGLCTALDPSFQFMSVAEPFAEELIRPRRGAVGALQAVGSEVRSLASAVYSIPYLSRDALSRVQQGEFDFHHELGDVVRAVETVEHGIRRLIFALLLAAILVAGAFLFPTHYRLFSGAALVVVLLLVLGLLIPFRRAPR
jgi:predicted unusual protein kinase regulating ubiquinone biosynthesis (AarF/ABC1/UbiB family)